MKTHSMLAGSGAYIPEQRLTNAELASRFGVSEAWISERTGIEARAVAGPDEPTSLMATRAAQKAIESAGLPAAEIGLIIVATVTADYRMPSVACQVQAALGCQAATFDLGAACCGFLNALQVADQFIRTGTHQHVLVVGVDCMTRLVDPNDRSTAILFGDGAGAAVLSAAAQPGILGARLYTDGEKLADLYVPGGGTAQPDGAATMCMRGRAVFQAAVRGMTGAATDLLKDLGLSIEDVDLFVPHQANSRITQQVAQQLGLPSAAVVETVRTVGNTGAATIPHALYCAAKTGRLSRGDLVLVTAAAAGMTWGAALISY